MRVPGGVHHHHAILVEQARVALHQHGQIGAVLEVEPGAAVGQRIGAAGCRNVERRAHATAAFLVAAALGGIGAGQLPVAQLGGVRAALVAARDKIAVASGQLFQRLDDVLALDTGGIVLGAHQDEVVVHHGVALHAPAVGDKLFFGHLVVHEQHIRVAAARRVERLPCTQGHHLHIQAAGLLELGQQISKQPRLLGGRGGRHGDGLRKRRSAYCKNNSWQRFTHKRQRPKRLQILHTISPLTNNRAASGRGPLKKSCTGKSASTAPCSR